MTLIRPEGIWQSADYRTTLAGKIYNDATPKQLHVIYPPAPGGPVVLMGYSGLAETADGMPMVQWIRETLRGESRFIMPSLEHLAERLTRDVSSSRYGGEMLLIAGGIFEGDRRFYFRITNTEWDDSPPHRARVHRQFSYNVTEYVDTVFIAFGSGRFHVSLADQDLVRTQGALTPAHWEDHLGLLAAINRRVARDDKQVSPWCHASCVLRDRPEAVAKLFAEPGQFDGPSGLQTLLYGVDTHEIAAAMLAAMESGMDQEDFAARMAAASQRAIDGRP